MAQYPLYDNLGEMIGLVEVESDECGLLRRGEELFVFQPNFVVRGEHAYVQNGGPIEEITEQNFTPSNAEENTEDQ